MDKISESEINLNNSIFASDSFFIYIYILYIFWVNFDCTASLKGKRSWKHFGQPLFEKLHCRRVSWSSPFISVSSLWSFPSGGSALLRSLAAAPVWYGVWPPPTSAAAPALVGCFFSAALKGFFPSTVSIFTRQRVCRRPIASMFSSEEALRLRSISNTWCTNGGGQLAKTFWYYRYYYRKASVWGRNIIKMTFFKKKLLPTLEVKPTREFFEFPGIT